MNLSYSLIDHWQACAFRTKLFDFERYPRVDGTGDSFRAMIGTLAHAGQKALFTGADVRAEIARTADWQVDRLPFGLPKGWDKGRLVDRCVAMVDRFTNSVPSFSYQSLRPLVYEDRGSDIPGGSRRVPLVDARLWVPLEPAIGIFKAFVFKPDLVAEDEVTEHTWLYDWKWTAELSDPENLRYDLQSAMYQWGLYQLGITVVGHGHVEGLIEEPTPFRVNQDGHVSTRAVRNSWEEYVRACTAAGHDPDEIMRERCMPTLRHNVSFRGRKEVEAIWRETVTPIALQISAAATGAGFPRRQSRFMCGRCTVREDCQQGQMGNHQDSRMNMIQLATQKG